MRFADLGALPEPVMRYFKYTLKEGQRPIRFCALKQRGAFRCQLLCLIIQFLCLLSGILFFTGDGEVAERMEFHDLTSKATSII